MNIELETKLIDRGIQCSHPFLGTVATIEYRPDNETSGHEGRPWFVFPYVFEPRYYAQRFASVKAAEAYALALAYEMIETRKFPKAA